MIKVIFPTGEALEFSSGASLFEVLKAHDRELLKKTVAARVDGVPRDLRSTIDGDGPVKVEPVVVDSPEGREILRHSTAHVLAEAVKSLYSNVKVAIGPAIEDGFYYDFDVEKPFTPEDLE
ncbi:MAG TPA: TGS domain-containing protein, partial [Thermodesulfobacteriota bacterium]